MKKEIRELAVGVMLLPRSWEPGHGELPSGIVLARLGKVQGGYCGRFRICNAVRILSCK